MHSSRMLTVRCSGRWGCIPACTGQGVYLSMHWAGGCLPRGVSAQEVAAQWGSAQGIGVCPCACWDTQPPVDTRGDVCPSACWDTPTLWTESLTRAWENITFLQLRLLTVNMSPYLEIGDINFKCALCTFNSN